MEFLQAGGDTHTEKGLPVTFYDMRMERWLLVLTTFHLDWGRGGGGGVDYQQIS